MVDARMATGEVDAEQISELDDLRARLAARDDTIDFLRRQLHDVRPLIQLDNQRHERNRLRAHIAELEKAARALVAAHDECAYGVEHEAEFFTALGALRALLDRAAAGGGAKGGE